LFLFLFVFLHPFEKSQSTYYKQSLRMMATFDTQTQAYLSKPKGSKAIPTRVMAGRQSRLSLTQSKLLALLKQDPKYCSLISELADDPLITYLREDPFLPQEENLLFDPYLTPPSSNIASPTGSVEEASQDEDSSEESDDQQEATQVSNALKEIPFFSPLGLKELNPIPGKDAEQTYLNGIKHSIELFGKELMVAIDKNGYGVVHYAAMEGYLNILHFLNENGYSTSLHLLDYYGNNPLLLAVQHGQLKVVSYLISYGVNYRHRNNNSYDALRIACENLDHQMLSLLLSQCQRLDLNEQDDQAKTILHYACARGKREIVEPLVRKGALATLKDCTGANCLTVAVMLGHYNLLDLLIIDRTILDFTDRFGRTALHWACILGNLATVKFLVGSGAKLELRDRKGRTPLLLGSFSNHAPIVQFLREKKACKDVEDYEGRPPNFKDKI